MKIVNMNDWAYWIGIAGTIAFSVTAVLAPTKNGIDLFGALVLAIITAVGGGTLRDIIIDVPVFWSIDESYIWFALGAAMVSFYAKSLFTNKGMNKFMLYADAAGISLFSIQAVEKVWDMGFGVPVAPVLLGIITAIGGGIIRDVLAGRENLLTSKDLYAIPVLLGCILFASILEFLPEFRIIGGVISIALIFTIRVTAIEKNLKVPTWLLSNFKQ